MTETDGEAAWESAVRSLVPGPVKFEGRGLTSADYRYYSTATAWIKVQRGEGDVSRNQDLTGEAAILRRAEGLPGVPRLLLLDSVGEFDVMVTERVAGRPFGMAHQHWPAYSLTLLRLSWLLTRLSLRGVSHNDLTAGNVLVDERGRPSIIDFDQAVATSRMAALRDSFLGSSTGEVPVSLRRLLDVDMHRRAPGFIARLGRLKRRIRRIEHPTAPTPEPLPQLPTGASPPLRALSRAWQVAAGSSASAPDHHLAYYSLAYDGIAFPGEREWEPRWEQLSAVTNLRGRRVLELGCNMGLLSTFALRAGAASALGVDHDEQILQAARLVADAYGVAPEFMQVDFDSPDDWESRLRLFEPDVVFALNVSHWLRDPRRFFAFLGGARELVYEGHDPYHIEAERLREVGFTDIQLIGWSDRARAILLAGR